jgi:hypothetical protein
MDPIELYKDEIRSKHPGIAEGLVSFMAGVRIRSICERNSSNSKEIGVKLAYFFNRGDEDGECNENVAVYNDPELNKLVLEDIARFNAAVAEMPPDGRGDRVQVVHTIPSGFK